MDENEPMNEPIQTDNSFNNYNNYYAQEPVQKKKGKKSPIIFILIIILIVAALVGIYAYMTTPVQYYKMLTNSIMDDAFKNTYEKDDYETAKSTLQLDADIQPKMEIIDEEVLDLINNLTLEVEVQEDKNQQQLVLGINADYEKEDLLDVKSFIDGKNKEAYLYVPEFLDKYFEMEMEEGSIYSELIESFDTEIILGKKINAKKLNNIIKKEITKNIKSEYCSVEKATIKVQGNDVKTSCKTIQMTPEQMIDSLIAIFDNLLNNEELFNLINEEYKEDLKETLETYKEELEYEKEDLPEDMIIKLNTYTTGLLRKIVKVELVMEDIEEETSLIIEATKLEEQKYSFAMKVDGETMVNGNVAIAENSMEIEAKIEEFGSFEIEIGATQEYNVEIDKIDENNITAIEELTEQEVQTLIQNLQKSKLVEVINLYIPEENVDTSLDNDTTQSNDNVSGLQDNQIYTYDDKTLITFGTISGYESDRISENYQTLTKGDVRITVASDYNNKNGYYQTLNSTKEYFSEQSYYSDVTLSNMQSTTIGENTFYHATLQYKYNTSEEIIAIDYIWAEVSDDYVVEIEIENMKDLTDGELQQLLTMTFEQ